MKTSAARSKEFYRPASLIAAAALASILFFVTLTVAAQPNLQDGASVFLQGPDGLANVGDEITVTVGISDVVNLFGVQMFLDFDPANLQVVDADGDADGIQILSGECPIPDFVNTNSADNTAGTIGYVVTQLNPEPPFSGDCDVAYIRFQTLQVTTTVVHFSDLLLADPNHGSIPYTATDLILDIVPPAPIAEFSGTPTSGIAPVLVDFTNLSTGDYDSCLWDFGDGNSSTVCADPSSNYTTGGIYTVSLTVAGPSGPSTEVKTDYITIHAPVSADFTGSPTSAVAPQTVEFTNLSSGDFDACSWDFGDGSTSSNCVDPSNEYATHGVYTVSLSVSGLGGYSAVTKTDYITMYEQVSADFSGTPTNGIAPHQVDFVNLSSGDFDSCSWEFGDGGSSSDCADPSHQFDSGGVYTVTLTVSGLGGTDSKIEENYVTVYEPASAAFSGSPTSGVPPLLVDFIDLSSGDYDTCAWDFGDGNTSTTCANPSNEYLSSGVYTVSLTVSGLGGSDSEIQSEYITVYEPVAADFSATPTSGDAPLTVVFTNLSLGDFDTCSWDFGDGVTSDDCDAPSHSYVTGGIYDVSLTVVGPGGTDTETKIGYITVSGDYFAFMPLVLKPN
jgi:PKD repeat protein